MAKFIIADCDDVTFYPNESPESKKKLEETGYQQWKPTVIKVTREVIDRYRTEERLRLLSSQEFVDIPVKNEYVRHNDFDWKVAQVSLMKGEPRSVTIHWSDTKNTNLLEEADQFPGFQEYVEIRKKSRKRRKCDDNPEHFTGTYEDFFKRYERVINENAKLNTDSYHQTLRYETEKRLHGESDAKVKELQAEIVKLKAKQTAKREKITNLEKLAEKYRRRYHRFKSAAQPAQPQTKDAATGQSNATASAPSNKIENVPKPN